MSIHDFPDEGYTDVFSKHHDTWVIAFCPDSNSFFATDQRCFFWESEEEFPSEKEAIEYFESNLQHFAEINVDIQDKMCNYGWGMIPRIWLENTNRSYEIQGNAD